jgi:hypothetical protein
VPFQIPAGDIRHGRVVGRVDARGDDTCEPIKGWLCVVVRSQRLDFAHELWIDPPWADPELRLLFEIVEAGRGFREIWAKVPMAFDPARIPGAVPEAWFGHAPGDRQRIKFVLLRRGGGG